MFLSGNPDLHFSMVPFLAVGLESCAYHIEYDYKYGQIRKLE